MLNAESLSRQRVIVDVAMDEDDGRACIPVISIPVYLPWYQSLKDKVQYLCVSSDTDFRAFTRLLSYCH
jgi:hypothetical protein